MSSAHPSIQFLGLCAEVVGAGKLCKSLDRFFFGGGFGAKLGLLLCMDTRFSIFLLSPLRRISLFGGKMLVLKGCKD